MKFIKDRPNSKLELSGTLLLSMIFGLISAGLSFMFPIPDEKSLGLLVIRSMVAIAICGVFGAIYSLCTKNIFGKIAPETTRFINSTEKTSCYGFMFGTLISFFLSPLSFWKTCLVIFFMWLAFINAFCETNYRLKTKEESEE